VRTLPPRMLFPLGIAVVFLFAMMGFIVDIASAGLQPWSLLVTNVIASGTLGVAYGYSGLRSTKHRIATGAVHAIYLVVVVQLFTGTRSPSTPEDIILRLRLDAVGIITCMAVSYSAFVRFTGTTGAQYLQTRAEIRLASEIHAVLVPRLARTLGQYEFYGVSRASGDVGGDLVDIVERSESAQEWIGYVADVSGHGVSSGVLMGMTKSAARMRLRAGGTLTSLANDLNDVLLDLKRPSMYVPSPVCEATPRYARILRRRTPADSAGRTRWTCLRAHHAADSARRVPGSAVRVGAARMRAWRAHRDRDRRPDGSVRPQRPGVRP
jgi:hypothetical protein